jgi:hypothetical protein
MQPRNEAKFRKYENPSRVPESATVRVLTFKTLDAKAHWLDAASSLDALRGEVQRQAKRFLLVENAEARTRAIQRFVRDNVKYQYDWRTSQALPGEEFADTSTTLERGFGDCDDKARAFVALMRAAEMLKPLGTRARIRPVFAKMPDDRFTHVQAEVIWPGSARHENAMGPEGWLLAELIVRGCEIGQDPDTVPKKNGQRQIV